MEPADSSADINPTQEDRDWQTSDLCEQCQDVDLDKVLVAPIHESGSGQKGLSDTFDLRISEGSTCPLCKFYARALPAGHQLQPENAKVSLQRWTKDPDYILVRSVLPYKHRVDDYNDMEMKIVPVSEKELGRSRYLDIHSRSIDYGVLTKWISHCEDSHDNLCREPQLSSLKTTKVRVIDCHTRTVTVLEHGDRYVALSYVWGPPEQEQNHSDPKTPLQDMNGKSIQVSNVIEDAMTVTIKLGLQFLWVDQVCINQNDADEKQQQLRYMDHIYNQAFLTIVAAAGDRASYGLPGVGKRSRTIRPRIKLNGTTWTTYYAYPWQIVEKSTWKERGWTFQESFFTRRFFMFTDEQVIFECGGMLQTEDRVRDLNSPRIGWGINDFTNIVRQCDSKAHPFSLMFLIMLFTSRKLTNEEDILEAMDGLFSFYSKLEPPIETFWGIPVRWSGYSMDNIALKEYRAGDSEFKHDNVAGAVLLGLRWFPFNGSRPVTRREGFPSWSWSGWKTRADGMDLPWRYRETPSILDIPLHVVTTNKELVAVDDAFARTLASGNSYETLGYTQTLQIETQVLEIPFVKWEDYEGRCDSTLEIPMYNTSFKIHGDSLRFAVVQNVDFEGKALVWPLFLTCSAADTEDICKDPRIMSANTTVPLAGTKNPDPHTQFDKHSYSSQMKTIECVVIDHKYGLLIQTRDGISSRVGLMCLEGGFLKDGRMRGLGANSKEWDWTREVHKRDLRDYFPVTARAIYLN